MRSVVIVEGDAAVAEGLRRSLKAFARSWEVRFVPTAQAALAALPADAVICDAHGASLEPLLVELKEQHPRAARCVVVPAEMRGDALSRLQALSHQLLRKPLLPAALVEAVERTVGVIEALGAERLKLVVGQLGDLPPLPATYSRISQRSIDPDSTLDELASIVERDPAVSGAVLRIINSAYFGLPRRVASVREAVKYLGIVPLKNLVLTVELFEGLALGKRAAALQEEALLRAYAMRELLGQTPLGEQAFLCGILADVGHLLLIARLPLDVQALERRSDVPPWVAQRERLGCSAAELGGQLLSLWNLPAPVIEAVTLQHEPPLGSPAQNLTCALQLVCAVEWGRRAPPPERKAFRAVAEELVVGFPSASLDRLERYFSGAEQRTA